MNIILSQFSFFHLSFIHSKINIISWFQKRQRGEALRDLVLHQTVTAVVEIVKENYLASDDIIIQFRHLLVKHFHTY